MSLFSAKNSWWKFIIYIYIYIYIYKMKSIKYWRKNCFPIVTIQLLTILFYKRKLMYIIRNKSLCIVMMQAFWLILTHDSYQWCFHVLTLFKNTCKICGQLCIRIIQDNYFRKKNYICCFDYWSMRNPGKSQLLKWTLKSLLLFSYLFA